MGENQARQIWVGVVANKGTGLQIGEMAYIGSNALFEVRCVRAFGEHLGIVIRFEETSVALAEILANLDISIIDSEGENKGRFYILHGKM